jgi:hypothetical protein
MAPLFRLRPRARLLRKPDQSYATGPPPVAAAREGTPLAIKLRGLLVILAMGCAMLPALRDVIRKQDEALAYLHKRRTLGRIAYHLGGVRAGVCFLQIDARVCHEAAMRSLENGSMESMEPDIHVRR